MKQSVQSDNVLVWLLQGARIRLVVPDAATGVAWQDETMFVERLRPFLSPAARALEIGCGAGRVSRHVAPAVQSLVACDVSKTMLREAQGNLATFSNVRLVRTRGFTLDNFADGEFDIVFAHGVLGHLDPFPLLALLAGAHRILRPGGCCIANFHTLASQEDGRVALREALRSAGGYRLQSSERPYTEDQIAALYEVVGFQETTLSRMGGPGLVADVIAVAVSGRE